MSCKIGVLKDADVVEVTSQTCRYFRGSQGISSKYCTTRGTAVAQWLRRCATSQKVAGSMPDGVIGIFH